MTEHLPDMYKTLGSTHSTRKVEEGADYREWQEKHIHASQKEHDDSSHQVVTVGHHLSTVTFTVRSLCATDIAIHM